MFLSLQLSQKIAAVTTQQHHPSSIVDSGSEMDEALTQDSQDDEVPTTSQIPQQQPTQTLTRPKQTKKGKTAPRDLDRETESLLDTVTNQSKETTELQGKITGMLATNPVSSPAAWGTWMGTMAESLHQDLLPRFYTESFSLMMGLQAESRQYQQRQRPPPLQSHPQQQQPPMQQQAPPPPLQQQPQQQQQQQQRQQQQTILSQDQMLQLSTQQFASRQHQQFDYWQSQAQSDVQTQPQAQPQAQSGSTRSDVVSWNTITPTAGQQVPIRPSSTPSNWSLRDISLTGLTPTGFTPDVSATSPPPDSLNTPDNADTPEN